MLFLTSTLSKATLNARVRLPIGELDGARSAERRSRRMMPIAFAIVKGLESYELIPKGTLFKQIPSSPTSKVEFTIKAFLQDSKSKPSPFCA